MPKENSDSPTADGTPDPATTDDLPAVPASAERTAIVEEGLAAATHALEEGDLAGAWKLALAMTQLAPDEPQGWAVKARVLRASGELDAADMVEADAIKRMAQLVYAARPPLPLRDRMREFSKVTFLGGPPALFVELGQMQLMVMLEHGLEPHHRVLDIGCGALRAGLWLLKVLDAGNYCGIEPHKPRLQFGVEHVVGAELIERKQPRFDHNTAFDLSVFGQQFDFFVARSVWTHASKPQILAMLDGFVADGAPDAVFLTSFLAAKTPEQDYQGQGWVGRSESSPFGGLVGHDPSWIVGACRARGLTVKALREHVINQQIWLLIRKV